MFQAQALIKTRFDQQAVSATDRALEEVCNLAGFEVPSCKGVPTAEDSTLELRRFGTGVRQDFLNPSELLVLLSGLPEDVEDLPIRRELDFARIGVGHIQHLMWRRGDGHRPR